MSSAPRTDWLTIGRTALAAGVTGGLALELYVYLTTLLPQHGDIRAHWQWIASVAVGQLAYSSQTFAWIGLLIHFLVSIGWAAGYAYLAVTRGFMSQRWVASGIGFGFVVYVFMQFMLIGAGKFVAPSDGQLVNQLIGHCLFFGIPVAVITAKMGQKP
jgi:uncharacterized membrane protein YagU involved in acid resistance